MIHDTYSFVLVNSIYIGLITVELASIAIKYEGSNTNPFQERGPAMILFLLALFCHAIALKGKISLPTVMIIHISGVIACETLLWMLVAEIWRCIIINVLLILVAALSLRE